MNEHDDSLSWLAFRYVAGELSADEQAAFEARLDTEQSAREAVAREVELAQAVAIAAAPALQAGRIQPASADVLPGERVRRALWVRVGWMTIAAAASLVVGMVLGRGLAPWNLGEPALSPAEVAAQELAGYWQPVELAELAPVASSEPVEPASEAMLAEESPEVPTWLLAALEPEEPADAPQEN